VTISRHRFWMAVLLAVVCMAGCEKRGADPADADQAGNNAAPATTTAERGPVKMTVSAEPAEFSIADSLRVTVAVEAEQQVEVEMPDLAEIPNFEMLDFDRSGPQVTAEGKNRWQQEYELEVYFSGEYVIPSFKARFIDKRPEHMAAKADAGHQPEADTTDPQAEASAPDGEHNGEVEDEWNELQTDELKVTATSLVQKAEELTEIEDIVGPVALPRAPFVQRHAAALGIAAGVAAIAAVAVALLRRKREVSKQMLPAHVMAFRMLEWLIAQDFVGKGQLEQFYVHLCGVVRKYIEMRFEIHAPEETTEEFLGQMSQDGGGRSVLAEHRSLLKEFLEHADLVKFARHSPTDDEIQRSFNAAKVFIEATADDAVMIEAGGVEGLV